MQRSQPAADRLYSFLVDEEDARVCRDIPDEACTEVPGNFFKIGLSQILTKLSDELASAKTVLPWALAAAGAPTALTGFLVPIRESGSLLPQLVIAAAVRGRSRRKGVWVLGAILQALALAGMALAVLFSRGRTAGFLIVGLLLFFSLARGLVSVASKDVTGKTIPKTRRGRLTGYTTAVSGVLLVILGGILVATVQGGSSPWILALLLVFAALLWIAAGGVFATVKESPGATGGGKDALREAFARLDLLRTDADFRRFVWVRALLISTGLSAPFYITLARESSDDASLLALFVLASGLASALSSGFWGRYSDRSSRSVLVLAALVAASLGTAVFLMDLLGALNLFPWFVPIAYFFLAIAHGGVRVGRKTYLLDMAGGERRTDYVAVSNSVIGAVLLLGAGLGLLAPFIGSGGMILLLSVLGFLGALGGRSLPETQ